MNIYEIAEAMAKKFHLEKLQCENGTLQVEIDNTPVLIDATSDNVFILNGLVDDIPSEADVIDKFLLENNNILMNLRSVTCTRNQKTNTYVLIERIHVNDVLNFENFCEHLEKFMNTLESTRIMLQDFSLAQSQVVSSSLDANETKKILSAEFLRV